MRQNQSQNQKRSRGRGRRNNNHTINHSNLSRNSTIESNGPDGRVRGNAQQLFEKYTDPKCAVSCVKHAYTNCNGKKKMDGQAQEWYPKKNWSSLIMFNCGHELNQKLTPQEVNTKSGRWLHTFLSFCQLAQR